MQAPKLGRQDYRTDNTVSNASTASFINDHPRYTGRYFLIFNKSNDEIIESVHKLEKQWGLTVASTADFSSTPPDEIQLKDADALLFNELGVALVGIENEIVRRIELSGSGFLFIPEKVVYIPDEFLTENTNSSEATWGIQATEAIRSQYTGNNIKVAILDTGFDANHPDFEGRMITSTSFVPDESADDFHGHGTHCTGIACGSSNKWGEYYGIAKNAHIYSGKVLNSHGSGAQSWILNGITWAANNGCKVITLSLGSPVPEGVSYDIAYERAASFARKKGALVIAAAGNDSLRSKKRFSPVSSPADCPSVLAVGAIDKEMKVADFSNRAINPSGLVDFAAPGVGIYSSWLVPVNYRTLSGTSMATPHLAGIAALLFEKFPDASPKMIENELRRNARPLPLPSEDTGAGIPIAP